MPSGKIHELYMDKNHTEPLYPLTSIRAITNDNDVDLNTLLDEKVPITRTINGRQLDGNISFGPTQCKAVAHSAKQTFNERQQDIVRHNVGMMRADWSEENSHSYSYIQNKTHGIESKIITETIKPEVQIFNYYTDVIIDPYTAYCAKTPIVNPKTIYYVSLQRVGASTYIIKDEQMQFDGVLSFGTTEGVRVYGNRITNQWGPEIVKTGDYILTLEIKETENEKVETTEKILDVNYLPIPNSQINNEIANLSKSMGKQVYCKLLDCGPVPSKKVVDVPITSENITVVQVDAYVINETTGATYSLPYMDPNVTIGNLLTGNLAILFAYARNNNLTIKSTFTQNGYKIYALVYYIYK